jgi:tetratricopeptide (TPR) repeat protein
VEQKRDLQELADRNVRHGSVYEALATMRIADEGLSAESLHLLRQAVALTTLPSQPFVYSFADDKPTFIKATYDLLACGDAKTVLNVCDAMKPFHHPLKTYQTSSEEGQFQFYKALALRETGQEKESKAILKALSTLDYRRKRPLQSELHYFTALIDMDDSMTSEAAKDFEKGLKVADAKQNPWLRDLTSAWLLYQQGQYAEALKKTDQVRAYFSKDKAGIRGCQAKSALKLLRAHIFIKQGALTQAREELAAYRDDNLGGLIYIPKVYRSWIAEVATEGGQTQSNLSHRRF